LDRDAAGADSAAVAAAAARRAEAAHLARLEEIAQAIFFDYDQFDVRAVDRDKLARKVAILQAHPAMRLRVVGHADERGSDEYNIALGMRRAVATRDFLVRLGVDGSRIETSSMGEEMPRVRTNTEAAHAQNRRAEFDVIAGGHAPSR
jgi:peptidoglycan-associated lipoprotein